MTNYTQALNRSLILWQWLAINPDKCKIDAYNALGWAELYEDAANCPLCQYVEEERTRGTAYTSSACEICPLYDKWSASQTNGSNAPCTNVDSPYMVYNMAQNHAVRQVNARAVITLLQRQIVLNGFDPFDPLPDVYGAQGQDFIAPAERPTCKYYSLQADIKQTIHEANLPPDIAQRAEQWLSVQWSIACSRTRVSKAEFLKVCRKIARMDKQQARKKLDAFEIEEQAERAAYVRDLVLDMGDAIDSARQTPYADHVATLPHLADALGIDPETGEPLPEIPRQLGAFARVYTKSNLK